MRAPVLRIFQMRQHAGKRKELIAAISPTNAAYARSGFRLRHLDRAATLLPGTEAPLDMSNRLQSHALRSLRGER